MSDVTSERSAEDEGDTEDEGDELGEEDEVEEDDEGEGGDQEVRQLVLDWISQLFTVICRMLLISELVTALKV